MYLDPDKATTIKLAALICCIIRTFMHDSYTPDGYVDFETKWILWIGIGEKTVSLSVFKVCQHGEVEINSVKMLNKYGEHLLNTSWGQVRYLGDGKWYNHNSHLYKPFKVCKK